MPLSRRVAVQLACLSDPQGASDMDLLSLPSPAWALIAGYLAPDGVVRLSTTCKAAQSRNKELESSLWNSILRRELRYAAEDAEGPMRSPDPLRTYREVRTLPSPLWMRAREPARAPQPKNGGGLARLGAGPEIILFGGSNHRISRHSSDICNEVAVLRITTTRKVAVSGDNAAAVPNSSGVNTYYSGDEDSAGHVGEVSTSDGSVMSDEGSIHCDEPGNSADGDEEQDDVDEGEEEEEEKVVDDKQEVENEEVREGDETDNESEEEEEVKEEEEGEVEETREGDETDNESEQQEEEVKEEEEGGDTGVPAASASGPQGAEDPPGQPGSALEFSADWDLAPEVKGDPPLPRWGHSCTSVVDPADGRDAVFIYGGFGGGQILGDAYLLKRCKGGRSEGGLVLLWEELRLDGDPPEPCAFHSATEIAPGVIVIIGGLSDGCTSTNVMFADLARRRWIHPAMQGVPKPSRAGHAAVFVPLLNPSEATTAPAAARDAVREDGCSLALLGHLWLVGGCRRTEIGEEDEFHTSPCVLEVLRLEEQNPGGTEMDLGPTLALRWLEEATAETMTEVITGRCPLCTRVGRNIIMWGGFYQGRPQHFQEELTVLDTEDFCSAPRSLSPGVAATSIAGAPMPREGGGCLAYVDDKAVAMVVFGGATFDVSSDMTGVHLLVVSLSNCPTSALHDGIP